MICKSVLSNVCIITICKVFGSEFVYEGIISKALTKLLVKRNGASISCIIFSCLVFLELMWVLYR
jgi:hypothetical protein